MVWSARHQCLALAWAKLSRLTPCRYVVSWTIVHLVLYTQWYAIRVMYEWCVYTYYLDHAHIGNDKRQQTIFAPRKWHLFCHEVRRFSRYHPGKCPQTRWTWMFLALGTDGHPLQSWNNCPALMPALYRLLVNIRMFRDPGTHFWGMLSSWSVPKHTEIQQHLDLWSLMNTRGDFDDEKKKLRFSRYFGLNMLKWFTWT